MMHNPHDWARQGAIYHPESLAVQDMLTGQQLTYARLNSLADFLAWRIMDTWQLKPGDRVALLAPNHPFSLVLFALAQKTGLTLVPLNWRLSPPEIHQLLTDAQPELLIYDTALEALLEPAQAQKQIPLWLTWQSLCKWLEEAPPDSEAWPQPPLAPDHPLFLLYTSGTTGTPKGAIYSHEMLLWNSLNTGLRLDLTSTDCTLNVMPLFHTGGWNVLLTPLLHRGGATLLLPQFEAARVLDILATERISIFMGVPTMLQMMAECPRFEQLTFPHLRYVIVGGESMPVSLIETWHRKGIPVRQGYGMTEAGPNLTSLHQRDALRKVGSIGQPNYYVQSRIVDEAGHDVKPGQPGELLIKGPNVTPGYWQNPAVTAQALVDGWLHTGDRVRSDEEGFLYVVDRIKNMFISGGENVYPAEIERVLLAHTSITKAVVVSVPHPKWGEAGHAFVVCEGPALSPAELKAWCTVYLARYKVPKGFTCCNELPQNATGKVDRVALQQRLLS